MGFPYPVVQILGGRTSLDTKLISSSLGNYTCSQLCLHKSQKADFRWERGEYVRHAASFYRQRVAAAGTGSFIATEQPGRVYRTSIATTARRARCPGLQSRGMREELCHLGEVSSSETISRRCAFVTRFEDEGAPTEKWPVLFDTWKLVDGGLKTLCAGLRRLEVQCHARRPPKSTRSYWRCS